jgi:hypothetical protein
MRKTLILHIGHFKTGTTALQVFCATNQPALRKQGIDYTGHGLHHSKHSRPAFALYRAAGVSTLMHGYRNPTPPEQVWAELFEAVLASNSPRVLVSSEEFMRLGAHPAAEARLAQIIAPLRDRIDFQIIAYLRPPQSHLNSWYNQLVKMNIPVPGFNEALGTVIEPVHYDYALALGPWLRLFGPEAVTIRPYSAALRGTTALFEDFLKTLGITGPFSARRWAHPAQDVNARLDDETVEIHRIANALQLPKDQRDWLLNRLKRLGASLTPAPETPARPIDEIAAACEAGLVALEGLPHNGLSLDAMRADLPRPVDPQRLDPSLLIALLVSETHLLRSAQWQKTAEQNARIKALEERIEQLGAQRK